MKTGTGEIYLDNVEFSCDTRGVDATDAAKSVCVHNWNAVEIAGETDLYQYTCTNENCGYFFKGTATEFVKVVEFASITFDGASTRAHENLKLKGNGHGFTSATQYFATMNGSGMLDLTSNNYFWIQSTTDDSRTTNPNFTALMTGSYNGDQVDVVEMKFDFLYTGDIGQLDKTGLGLVHYQSTSSDKSYDVFKLYFDKSENGKNGLLYFDGCDTIVVEEGKSYTITLRMQPAGVVTSNGATKYALTLIVQAANGALISEYTKLVNNSYNAFSQIIFGRAEYRYAGVTYAGANAQTNDNNRHQDFHMYMDNLTVSYETPVEMQ